MPAKDNKFIKLVYEGDAQMRQINDNETNQDMSYEYTYMQKLGIAVLTNLKWGVWNIVA